MFTELFKELDFIGFVMLYLVWMGTALACGHLARDRGRSEKWGAFWGIALHIVAVLAYLIAGDSKELKENKLKINS
jgi:hypothetical protein